MTPQEMAKVLRAGSKEDKKNLFDELFQGTLQGRELTDSEIPIFEALKRDLMERKPEVVQMAATMKGVGGARV